jgi:succinyl-diaminopimelate desuccinylase
VNDKYGAVLSRIDEAELVDLTRALVRIPSVYRHGVDGANEGRVAAAVAEMLRAIGMDVTAEEVEPGRPNIIGVYDFGRPGPCLLFEGHTDVVKEGDRSDWEHDPFGAAVVDGRIYGRGAADMKGGLAAAISAAKALIASGLPLRGKLMIAALIDEEEMMVGAKHFALSPRAKEVDAAIICEPEDNQICAVQKGGMLAELHFSGKMAHGCMPYAGVNPIWTMAEAIVSLRQLEKSYIERWGENRYVGFPSITPTIIQSPGRTEPHINMIPAEGMIALDIRTIPGQEQDAIERDLQAIVNELSQSGDGTKAELLVLEKRPCTDTARDEPVIRGLETAIRAVTGREPQYNGVPGLTDGTFLANLAGIPVVTIGPGGRTIPHQANEYVEINQLTEAAHLYAVAAVEFLGFADA